jgi:hypothetical protein
MISTKTNSIYAWLTLFLFFGSVATAFVIPQAVVQPSSSQLSCIRVNCKRVTSCAAYHFVETKHEQPHMTEDPTFEPRNGSPTVHVNIRSIRNQDDQQKEIDRMWREQHKLETELAEETATGEDDEPLHGARKYDFAPVTTYEYDVVKCEDYVEDMGAWVRNMPEEIRKSNPNFVPS